MDGAWSTSMKIDFKRDVRDKVDSISNLNKKLEKEAKKKTRENKTAAQVDGTRVEYRDPARLKEVMIRK